MPGYLRQATAATVKLGPLVSPADGATPYTTAGFAAKLSANGGALAARHDTTAIAHDADGYFAVVLDATDTATVGRLRVEVPGSAGSYYPAWEDFSVLSAGVYDSLFGPDPILTAGPLAAAVGATSITLASTDPAAGTSQVGNRVYLTSGTGAGQVGIVTASDTTSRVQTVAGGWSAGVTPTGAVRYQILPPAASEAVASGVVASSPGALAFTVGGLPAGIPAAAYVGLRAVCQSGPTAGFAVVVTGATGTASALAITFASGASAPTQAPPAGAVVEFFP